MEKTELLTKLTEIFRDVFEDESIVLNDGTSAKNIDEWDSISHLILMGEIENRLGVRLTSTEIMKWENIGQMIDALITRM